jgi:hypothetical protein
VNKELQLFYAVADPLESHGPGPGASLLHCVVGDAVGAFVVGLDGCRRLWMSHFF